MLHDIAGFPMPSFSSPFAQFGLHLLAALLVLLVGIRLAAWVANMAQRALQRASIDITSIGFLRNLIYGALIAVLIVTALQIAGVPDAPLLAALGAGGLAIGLALQGSLSNLAWGVLLILFRPFRVGDFIHAGGIDGTVESINLMHTLLVMPDNREAVVPNAKIGSDAIINFNRRGTRRFELPIAIGYKDDIGGAMAEIKRLFDEDSRILKDPAPGVWTGALGDKSVSLIVRGWTRSSDNWSAKTDLLRAIKESLEKAGVTLAFP